MMNAILTRTNKQCNRN